MKNLLFTLLLSLITTLGFSQKEWCATDEMLEDYFTANPGKKAEFYKHQAEFMELPAIKGSQNNKVPTIIVPVVVHVIHYNGAGNITKQQIDDGMRVLNEDFQKLNSDTSNTRSVFQSVAADAQMEFRLAKIDPDGNCTEGINRVNSYLTYNNRNEVKTLAYWDANKYLNVWLVNSIRTSSGSRGSITLGYAQFPFSGALNTYGLVVRNDEWGSIGTASSSSSGGRTVTHEVGHCFNLFHTFQSGCGSFCQSSGDFVCDTPPAASSTFGCTTANNQCANDALGGTTANPNPYSSNVPDQLENYMSYDDCQTLFTEGQKDRMQAAFNVYAHLNSLRSAANLIATGTNNGYVAQTCPPKVDIIDQEKKLVCIGDQLSFDEQSYNGPITTYDWEFPGATPSTSSSATPTVTYTSPGVHNVILRASNASGADTLVIQNVVHANDTSVAYNGFNYLDSFDSATAFDSEWIVMSPSGNAEWEQVSGASFSGAGSVALNNYNDNSANELDFLISPSIDLTTVISPSFKFKLAYKTTTGANDVLKCAISLDCGQTWTTRLFLNSGNMNSGTRNNSNFIPSTASDWRDFTVTTTAAMRTSKNVLFRFDFTAGGGNNIYIDDFKVDGQPVGIETVNALENATTLYPNPSTDGFSTLEFKLEESSSNGSIFLTNIVGKRVQNVYQGSFSADAYKFNLNTAELSSGIYFVTLQTDKNRITKKLIVR